MALMSRKDGLTGNNLDPEPGVLYCGPNGDCYDGWLRVRESQQDRALGEARSHNRSSSGTENP